jgi:hypothetical protein
MKRLLSFAFVLLATPTLAESQTRLPPSTPGAIGLPLAPIGLPLPPIGLPLPAIGLPPPTVATPPPQPPSRVDNPRRPHTGPRSSGRGRVLSQPAVVYFPSAYPWGYPPVVQGTLPLERPQVEPPPASSPPNGWLRLEVEPSHALQVFVDGEFFGTIQDIGGELELQPGTRRIELRAPRYEALLLDARIVAERTITYRGALQPLTDAGTAPETASPAAPESPAPARRQTFYLIPGCYLGNIPPAEVKLPENCDLSRLMTHTP